MPHIPLSVPLHQRSTLIVTYTSLLPEGQIGQSGKMWGNFKNMQFGNRMTLETEVLACNLLVVKQVIKTGGAGKARRQVEVSCVRAAPVAVTPLPVRT
jgi:hypothetical protein